MKQFLSNFLRQTKAAFNKHTIINMVLVFLAFSLVFVAGAFSSSVSLEKSAYYATQLAIQTKKNLLGVTIESKDTQSLINNDTEFHSLYGVFKQRKITFASCHNADKQNDVRLLETEESNNLSLLYVGPVGSQEYNGHYKHYVYPMEIMFPDVRYYDTNRYCIYISQSYANKILENRGVVKEGDSYTLDQYQSLVASTTLLSINGDAKEYIIENIYYEQNYYYEGLYSVVNDFAIVSYYIHVGLKRQNIYFMSEYDYQNQYFMKYIRTSYSNKDFSINVLTNNIDKQINEKSLFEFYNDDVTSKNAVTVLLFITIGIIILFVFYRLLRYRKKSTSLASFTLLIITSLLPYLLFKLLFVLTNNIMLFTNFSAKANAILLIISIVVIYLFLFVIDNNWISKKSNLEKQNEELDI